MESGFQYFSQAPSTMRTAVRVVGGMVGGMLAAAVTMLVTAVLVICLNLPVFSTVGLGVLGLALGFVIGGAVARHLAGPRPSRGWMGLLFALAFALALVLLCPHGWGLMPEHSRAWVTSLGDTLARGRIGGVRDYLVPVGLAALIVSVALGCLGDVCMTPRAGRKTK